MFEADDRDRAAVASIMASLDEDTRPRVGDFIRFADGTMQRIAILERCGQAERWVLLQPARSGSWHLGQYGASYSGGPADSIPPGTVLTDSGEKRAGMVWVFHHGLRSAGRGVDLTASWRVYDCVLPASRGGLPIREEKA